MTDSGTPIHRNSARFRVNGRGRGQGIVLLYPDKLAVVKSWAELWGIFLGPLVVILISHFLFNNAQELGAATGVVVGGSIGQGIGKWLAASRATADSDGVRLIPLDSITSVQFRNSTGIGAWLMGQTMVVTTEDGTEHEFRGRLGGWQAALPSVLAVRGRDVQDTPQGITIAPS